MRARILLLLVGVLSLTACPTCARRAPRDEGGAPAPGSSVTVKGSDTLVLLGQRLAEAYMASAPGRVVQVTGGGSGTGIAALINGTTDIASASRALKDEERVQIEARRGGAPVETTVALDGIAVFVHRESPVTALSLPQLKAIYTGKLTRWSELGGPDAPIVLYGRENNSGTYAYFKERVLEEEDFAPETQTLPGTAAVVNAVTRDRNAIGYGGIAYDSGIRIVAVREDAGAEAVAPTEDAVVHGRYPISRPLFMYTAGPPRGAVKAFLDFALSPEGQALASKVGYYPLPVGAGRVDEAADANPEADTAQPPLLEQPGEADAEAELP